MSRETAKNIDMMQKKSISVWKRMATKLGINIPIILLMIKYAETHLSQYATAIKRQRQLQ